LIEIEKGSSEHLESGWTGLNLGHP